MEEGTVLLKQPSEDRMTRTVILHYHLFKNAGTSLDRILRENFEDGWVTTEFPGGSRDNSREVAGWIDAHPEAVAFSTHTAMGPVPQLDGTRIVSVMLLRDPVARIRSAYRFERKQQADTWGAELAKQHDLEGYVQARLARQGDRQCRNFQTQRLASMVPGDGPELARAELALKQLSVVGLVEDFDTVTRDLTQALRPAFPDFQARNIRVNTTTPPPETERDRRVNAVLEAANADDRHLWRRLHDGVS